MRLPQELRLPIFRDLISFITPFALRKIFQEYKKLTTNPTVLPRCSQSYSIKSGLPCKHTIQERIFKPPGVIKLEDVHPHWRFIKPTITLMNPPEPDDPDNAVSGNANAVSNDAIDPLLLVQNPPICKSKGRPVGALNRPRREAPDTSTQREPSGFELVERSLQSTTRRRGRPPGSGRRRGPRTTSRIAK